MGKGRAFWLGATVGVFLCSAIAARPQPRLFFWAKGDSVGIRLAWTLPLDRPLPAEYRILRRESRKNVYEPLAVTRRLPRAQWTPYAPADASPGWLDTVELMITAAADPREPDSVRRELLGLLQEMLIDDFPRVAPVLGTTYHDTTARSGRRYDYALAIGDSVVAEVLDVLAGSRELPEPPKNLQGKAADSLRIRLLWDFKGGQARGIWGYHVWRQAPGDTGFIRMTEDPIITLWIDENLPAEYLYADVEGLEKGKLYRYRVSAVDVFGHEGPWSEPVAVVARDARPILAPYGVVARPEGDSIIIVWEASQDYRAVGYHVYRWPFGMDTARVRLTPQPLPADVRRIVDRPGEFPTEHVAYAVTTVTEEGEESDLSLPHIVPVPDIIPPPPPRYFMGYGEVGKARLVWTRSMARDVWGYEVARALSPTDEFTLVSTHILEDTTFVDVLTPEAGRTTFWYRVRAVDRRGNRSDWTPAVLVLLPDIVPPPSPYFTEAAAEDGAIRLRWQIGAAGDLLGFWLNRYEDTLKSPITLNGGEPIEGTAREYRDSLVEPGRIYWYELVAIDSAFNLSMPSGRIAGQAYSTRPPAPPTLDSVYATPEGILVVWREVAATDAAIIVERSTDGERFTPITPLLPIAQRRFLDTAVRRGQLYYYRLRLRSLTTGNWSAPSTAATITP
ncbi:MAG: fibronectin type III domain-containing protein [Chlorobiota bacterium]